MTSAEQEALSIRYHCPRIIRAGSFTFLMQDGHPPVEITSLDQVPLAEELAARADIHYCEEAARAPKLTTLDLSDLGL